MAHENGRLLVVVCLGDELFDLVAERQPAGQADNARKLKGRRQPREEAHGTALGKATQHNAVRGDAIRNLLLDEGVEVGARLENAGLVCFTRPFINGLPR